MVVVVVVLAFYFWFEHMEQLWFLPVRRYAGETYAITVCLFVHLSLSSILLDEIIYGIVISAIHWSNVF